MEAHGRSEQTWTLSGGGGAGRKFFLTGAADALFSTFNERVQLLANIVGHSRLLRGPAHQVQFAKGLVATKEAGAAQGTIPPTKTAAHRFYTHKDLS